jgi:hypothetical protein
MDSLGNLESAVAVTEGDVDISSQRVGCNLIHVAIVVEVLAGDRNGAADDSGSFRVLKGSIAAAEQE